ncbi:hypothetical protein [Acidisphaera sp. L21]|uniref:hypothetical protein n=1 Tax=Acidisphaera sp. L21 TaxID=1641851 RepID=UPI00131AB304|nr:hypothetical protein [Acidisphaera sp. L21]
MSQESYWPKAVCTRAAADIQAAVCSDAKAEVMIAAFALGVPYATADTVEDKAQPHECTARRQAQDLLKALA